MKKIVMYQMLINNSNFTSTQRNYKNPTHIYILERERERGSHENTPKNIFLENIIDLEIGKLMQKIKFSNRNI